ncbi:MAG: hypothetical protein QG597_181 [Actinomycetota bacterium]|nr:hypothetical protein [Actinomycetota bacterium]
MQVPGNDVGVWARSASPRGSGRLSADASTRPTRHVPAEQRLRSWSARPHPWWGYEPEWATRPEEAGWWWLGVHGGAGVTTLETWLPGGVDAHRAWPDPRYVGPPLVVLVARTHVAGLIRAAWALRQAATGDVPSGVQVAGVVGVADSPAGFVRPQVEALRRLRGLTPHLWLVPWIDELRLVAHPGDLGVPHPAVVRLCRDLADLAQATSARALSAAPTSSTSSTSSTPRRAETDPVVRNEGT